MLQTLKKLNYSKFLLTKVLKSKALVAIFATGLFVVNGLGNEFSNKKSKTLLLKASNNLSNKEYDKFILGKSFFRIPWVEAPSATTARDGLGPLFNANTCVSCHPGNGRGNLYNNNGTFSRSIVAKPSYDPIYGNQIAINAVHGVKFEAKPDIKFEEIKIKFPDGEIDTLLKPIYKLKNMQYGPLHKDTILSFRIAPSLNGLGLISQISDKDILKNVDEFDKDGDGISGRANYVYSPITKKEEIGRFSWKANITSLEHQVADAANNDLGLTTTYYPSDTCTQFQKECNNAPKPKDSIDLTNQRVEAIAFYLKNIKAYSAKLNKKNSAYQLFKTIGCVKCHVDNFKISSGDTISPFSDFLLHDMGEGLADGKVEFKAKANEWKTPALWGISLHEKINKKKPRLLHDGRARTLQEAILWHGGEAKESRSRYMNLEKKQREEIINFLKEI